MQLKIQASGATKGRARTRVNILENKGHVPCIVIGSVDHGKSTLIGRLLHDTKSLNTLQNDLLRKKGDDTKNLEYAFVLDHLEEERRDHITIDTTQVNFQNGQRNYLIIDAPGHREFLKNMITGASQASAAILLIDASEGEQDQTRRHAHLLKLLGIKQVILLVNKMDMVEYKKDYFDRITSASTILLNNLELEMLAAIPISAQLGDNIISLSAKMRWYKGKTLLNAMGLFSIPTIPHNQPLRLVIQDCYQENDKKIFVGKVVTGTVSVGQHFVACPQKDEGLVESLKNAKGSVEKAMAGENIGFTLPENINIKRGHILCSPNSLTECTSVIKATIFWMANSPLRLHEKITIHLATQQISCVIRKIENRLNTGTLEVIERNARELANTEVASVTLVGNNLIAYDRAKKNPQLGRFVLIRYGNTVGGGIVE